MTTDRALIAHRMGIAEQLVLIAAAISNEEFTRADQLAADLPPAPTTTIRFSLTGPEEQQNTGSRSKNASLSPREKLKVYQRDGYIDRYSPERWKLLNPGALRVLSLRLPRRIPTKLGTGGFPDVYNANSPVWFDVWPAVDHIAPRAYGGLNASDNLICVSWWRNASKREVSLRRTGWIVQSEGNLAEWDGLTDWFHRQVVADPGLLSDVMVKNWYAGS